MKILVAEDDLISALVLRRSLEKLGHEVWVEPNGERAWELLRGQQFRVVISDWMMPKMNGLDLCRNIRERDGRPYVYFILLTIKGSPEDRAEAMTSGIDDFLVKPIDPADLVSRLVVAHRMLVMKDRLEATGQAPASPRRPANKPEIGAILVEHGIITDRQLESALAEQMTSGQRIGEILCANGWAEEEDIARAHANQMDVGYVAVGLTSPSAQVLSLIPQAIAVRYRMLPISVELGVDGSHDRLRVAMENPWDFEAIAFAERASNYLIEPLKAAPLALRTSIDDAYRKKPVARRSVAVREQVVGVRL
jgi:CheY-like chemotaxis protein